MYTADLIVTNDWGIGFTANLVITNLSNEPLDWSQLSFDAPFAITNLWNGEILSDQDGSYVIANLAWNRTIPAGESISIGFNGSKPNGTAVEFTNLTLAGWGQPVSAPTPSPTPAPAPVLPTIMIADVSLAEGNTTTMAEVVVRLSTASDQSVTVGYSTADGSAIAGVDYTTTSGTLTFAPGETEKIISVPVLGDTQVESDETFTVRLFDPSNGNLTSDTATITLENDDVAPPPVTPPAPNTDGAISFDITNDWGTGFSANVTIRNDGSAPIDGWNLRFDAPFAIEQIWNASFTEMAGAYAVTPIGWNQTIAPGDAISFGFVGAKDPSIDPTPTNYVFNGVDLGSPAPQPMPTPPPVPTLSISDATVTEGANGAGVDVQAEFSVTLSDASNQDVTVSYSTANGSAVAGEDYTSASGTVTFAPGETVKTIRVAIADDPVIEGTETFTLNLSSPLAATLADTQAIGTILSDDVAPAPIPTPSPTPTPTPSPTPTPGGGTPSTGQFNYAEALQKSFLFYEAQRSGPLPSDNRIEWRGDSALSDGADVGVDLTGGYYDAGDHVKFGLPMAYSMTMLSWGVDEYQDAYAQIGQLDEALDAIKWGTDYILKAHVTDANGTKEFWGQVGDGFLDHSYWGAPETMTMDRPAFKIDRQNPGTDLAAEAAASLAAASLVFRGTDAAYADELLTNAKQLFDFADTYRGKYSDAIPNAQSFYNSWSGYNDELAWGAAWLYEATGEVSYLQKAESVYQNQLGSLNPGWTINWDDKSYGAAVLLAQQTGDTRYQQDVEGWLNAWANGTNGVEITNGGLRWISQWGSSRYAANTAFVAGVYADTVGDPNGAYNALAETTVDYLLGDNPRGASYVVGFGDNYPLQPHHRGAGNNFNSPGPNENILYGALVGGPNAPDDFAYEDSRSNYITNEVALDYNAGFTGVLARMVDTFGGTPLSNAELNALPGIVVDSVV